MDIFIKLFFSGVAVAFPIFCWQAKHRNTHWQSQKAVVKNVQILRAYINPEWLVTLTYAFDGKSYQADVNLAGREWPGGVFEGQKIIIRVQPNSPQKCFIETGSKKPFSNFYNYFAYGLSIVALIFIWIS